MCARFGVKSGRSAFSSGGEHVPPHTDHLYRCPPWGISVPVPILFIPLLLLGLGICPDPCGFMELLVLVLPYAGEGMRTLTPVSPLSSPPWPPLLLCNLPLTLAPQMCWACCGWFDGAWPLGGPLPGGKLTMLAKISQACSSGAPLV